MCTMRINGGSYGDSISVRESVVALPKPALSALHRPLSELSRNSWRVTGPISAATAESPTNNRLKTPADSVVVVGVRNKIRINRNHEGVTIHYWCPLLVTCRP